MVAVRDTRTSWQPRAQGSGRMARCSLHRRKPRSLLPRTPRPGAKNHLLTSRQMVLFFANLWTIRGRTRAAVSSSRARCASRSGTPTGIIMIPGPATGTDVPSTHRWHAITVPTKYAADNSPIDVHPATAHRDGSPRTPITVGEREALARATRGWPLSAEPDPCSRPWLSSPRFDGASQTCVCIASRTRSRRSGGWPSS